MRATKPPSGVMPLRSPMPSTVVSMWVAPASSAAKALAIAQPESLWPWNSMSQWVSRRSVPTSRHTCDRRGDADRVGDAQPVDHAQLVDRQVDPQQLGLLAAEGVLGAEAQLDVRRLRADPRQHLGRQVDDLVDALAVAELAQLRRGADHHVDAVHARVERDRRVFPVAADVGQDARVAGRGRRSSAGPPRCPARPAARSAPGTRRRTHPARGRCAIFCSRAETGVDELLTLAQGGVDDGVIVRET